MVLFQISHVSIPTTNDVIYEGTPAIYSVDAFLVWVGGFLLWDGGDFNPVDVGLFSEVPLENYRKQILDDINIAKSQMQVQLDKIAVYTPEAAQTNPQMQAHLEKQKEIEQTIAKFDRKLAQITEELITFSFLVGNKPLVIGGGIVDEIRHDLEEITKSLGQQLNFNGDSLLRDLLITKSDRKS